MQLAVIIVMSGTGSPRVPTTRADMGLGNNLYMTASIGFLAGVFYTGGHGYGQAIPDGQVPVAISVTAVRPTSMPLCWCDTNLDDLAPARIDGAMLGPAETLFGIAPTDPTLCTTELRIIIVETSNISSAC